MDSPDRTARKEYVQQLVLFTVNASTVFASVKTDGSDTIVHSEVALTIATTEGRVISARSPRNALASQGSPAQPVRSKSPTTHLLLASPDAAATACVSQENASVSAALRGTFANRECVSTTATAEVCVILVQANACASTKKNMQVQIARLKSVRMTVSDTENAPKQAVNASVIPVFTALIAILKTVWTTATTMVNASHLLPPSLLVNAIPSSAAALVALASVLSAALATALATKLLGPASATRGTLDWAAIARFVWKSA